MHFIVLKPILSLKITSIDAFNPQAKVLEDMYNCRDILELSYVAMVLLIMLFRAMGKSLQATTSWRPGKLLPATPLGGVQCLSSSTFIFMMTMQCYGSLLD